MDEDPDKTIGKGDGRWSGEGVWMRVTSGWKVGTLEMTDRAVRESAMIIKD